MDGQIKGLIIAGGILFTVLIIISFIDLGVMACAVWGAIIFIVGFLLLGVWLGNKYL